MVVTGLKGIKKASFKSENDYNKWLSGEINIFSETEENPIVRLNGVKVSSGSPEIIGCGYKLSFKNDEEYQQYYNRVENAKIQKALSYSNNAALYKAYQDGVNGNNWGNFDEKKISEMTQQLFNYYGALEIEGYKEQLRYDIKNSDELTDEEKADYLEMVDDYLKGQIEGTEYELVDPDTINKIKKEDNRKKTKSF